MLNTQTISIDYRRATINVTVEPARDEVTQAQRQQQQQGRAYGSAVSQPVKAPADKGSSSASEAAVLVFPKQEQQKQRGAYYAMYTHHVHGVQLNANPELRSDI